jgi:hypothetical protein
VDETSRRVGCVGCFDDSSTPLAGARVLMCVQRTQIMRAGNAADLWAQDRRVDSLGLIGFVRRQVQAMQLAVSHVVARTGTGTIAYE